MIDKYYRKEEVGYENKGKIKEHRKKVVSLGYGAFDVLVTRP